MLFFHLYKAPEDELLIPGIFVFEMNLIWRRLFLWPVYPCNIRIQDKPCDNEPEHRNLNRVLW